MQERNKSRSSLRDTNKNKKSKKSFSYNNDKCEKTQTRNKERPPLKEVKNESSVANDFAFNFLMDGIFLM